jgi:YD repeat-containing protein
MSHRLPTFDSGGNLATRTDARNKTGTYAYDKLNRVTSITYPDLTLVFTTMRERMAKAA